MATRKKLLRMWHNAAPLVKGCDVDVYLDEGAFMPDKAHSADAGFDLRTPKAFRLFPFSRKHINTGVHILIPEELKASVSPKSGLMKNYGIDTDGVVDGEYTGAIGVTLFNRGWKIKSFKRGDKIAQLVIEKNLDIHLRQASELPETERGGNGFGSSGR